jgi:hypothetical protein
MRRGFLRYAAIAARELGRYQASAYAVTLDGTRSTRDGFASRLPTGVSGVTAR